MDQHLIALSVSHQTTTYNLLKWNYTTGNCTVQSTFQVSHSSVQTRISWPTFVKFDNKVTAQVLSNLGVTPLYTHNYHGLLLWSLTAELLYEYWVTLESLLCTNKQELILAYFCGAWQQCYCNLGVTPLSLVQRRLSWPTMVELDIEFTVWALSNLGVTPLYTH